MSFGNYSEKSFDELIRQATYTPEELATLADCNVNIVRTACYEGMLKAEIINGDIISIQASDALEWMNKR